MKTGIAVSLRIGDDEEFVEFAEEDGVVTIHFPNQPHAEIKISRGAFAATMMGFVAQLQSLPTPPPPSPPNERPRFRLNEP